MQATCDQCGHEFSSNKSTAECPECGQLIRVFAPPEKPADDSQSPLNVIAGLLVLGAIVWTLMVVFEVGPSQSSAPPAATKPAIELVGETYADQSTPAAFIAGKVRNNTTQTISYAQIQFALYDDRGNRVGTAMSNINNLEPRSQWKFRAVCLERFSEYRLIDLTWL